MKRGIDVLSRPSEQARSLRQITPYKLIIHQNWTCFTLTTLHERRIINGMVNDSSERLTTVFFALADPTRRAILERLAHGEASGTELARPFSISVPAISKHLRVLEHADLILHRKDGRTHRFRLAARPMREAATWLEQYRHFWEAQFDSLDTYLQVTSEEEQEVDNPSST